MKTDRIRRAGVMALAVVGVLAVSWVLPPAVHRARRLCPVRQDGVSEAGAYAAFARRYGVDCSVCHVSYPQLTVTGYKFRTAGYRMPDEIGNEAKWSNWGDNVSIRTMENYKVAAAVTGTAGTASNGFSNSGLDMYPWEGAFGKYVATNVEIDFIPGKTYVGNPPPSAGKGSTNGSVSMTTLNMMATLPVTADSFVTLRTGLFSTKQGYGASDRLINQDMLSVSFAPKPSQIQPGVGGTKSFTYNSVTAPSGEGLEVAYNWKDTHVSAAVLNGYNSYNGSATQGEDNRLKDLAFFFTQLIGENAISASFYSGSTSYGNNAATANGNNVAGGEASSSVFPGNNWVDNYMRGAVYGTVKFLKDDKLDLLGGFCEGVDHTYDLSAHNASPTFHSMGWFAQLESVQHVMGQQLTTALAYGTNRGSTSTAGNRVSDVTLSFAVPIQNSKFAVDLQSQRTQQVGTRDTIANTAMAQWEFMF